MNERIIDWHGASIRLVEGGDGSPLLYLHDLVDLHGAVAAPQPFHEALAERHRLIAPAFPGCAGSGGIDQIDRVEDLEFFVLDLLDGLGLDRVDLVGTGLGGWVAAHVAVRHSHRLNRLVLVNAMGLLVPGAPTADFFMAWQRVDGVLHHDFRALFFAEPEGALARNWFPDHRAGMEEELLRYRWLTLAGRVGWTPPYCYDPKLRQRLGRVAVPTRVVWGAANRVVPVAHGEAYREGIPGAELVLIEHAGHAAIVEQPEAVARAVLDFLAQPAPAGRALSRS